MSNTPTSRDPQEDAANPRPPTDAAAELESTPAAAVEPSPKYVRPSKRSVVLMVLVAIAGIALILSARRLWPFNSAMVSTDNAYVRGQMTVLSPQVNGYVHDVLVKDFEHVKQGQALVRIDDRIYVERVHQAEAQLDRSGATGQRAAGAGTERRQG